MAYAGSIDLISGIRPKNSGTFPLVNAPDVFVSDPDVRLDRALNWKADMTSLYPSWTSKDFNAWQEGEICSWNGKLYICIDDKHWAGQSDITPDISDYWNIQTIGNLFRKYDAALYPLAYTGADTVTVGEIATVLGWKGSLDQEQGNEGQ